MNSRELGTVLAALRLWQANVETLEDEQDPVLDVVTDGGRFARLSDTEIDDLCVRLNVGADDPDDDPNEGAVVCYACGQLLPENLAGGSMGVPVEDPEVCQTCGDLLPVCNCVLDARQADAD